MRQPTLQTNSEIRNLSRRQLDGKWGAAALTTLVYVIITAILESVPISIPGSSYLDFGTTPYTSSFFNFNILSLLFSGALTIGLCYYHYRISREERPQLEDLFVGFKQLGQAIIASVLSSIIIAIGFLFLIVPGVILALGLSQTYFIMAEKPGTNAIDAMKESWEMMDGHKTQLFLLGLSFIPWMILTIFTLFIGLLWLIPYMYVSLANFYKQLRGETNDSVKLDDLLIDYKA